MKKHVLKCHTEFFTHVWNGTKKFEYRNNDRDFKVGDTVELNELKKELTGYTGRTMLLKIVYIMDANKVHANDHFCIFGFEILQNKISYADLLEHGWKPLKPDSFTVLWGKGTARIHSVDSVTQGGIYKDFFSNMCSEIYTLEQLDEHHRKTDKNFIPFKQVYELLKEKLKNNTMKKHVLKCHTEFFTHVWNGTKKFEYRNNDRDFKVGDTVELNELKKELTGYTGRTMLLKIVYIMDANKVHANDHFCIFGFEILQMSENNKCVFLARPETPKVVIPENHLLINLNELKGYELQINAVEKP